MVKTELLMKRFYIKETYVRSYLVWAEDEDDLVKVLNRKEGPNRKDLTLVNLEWKEVDKDATLSRS